MAMADARYLIHEANADIPQTCIRCGVLLSDTARFAPGQLVGQRSTGSVAQTYWHDGSALEADEAFCVEASP